jgi:hypothetical protein
VEGATEDLDYTPEPSIPALEIQREEGQDVIEVRTNPDYNDILRSIVSKTITEGLHSDIDWLLIEASLWNIQPPRYPCELDDPEPIDELDADELLWQTPIDRNTITVRNCKAVATEEQYMICKHSEQTVRDDCTTHNKLPDIIPPGTAVYETSTQTTPADFRMASIHIPIVDDFKAIHNDSAGHHGLEFSYRKLLKRCGSKWANERGQATRVKDATSTSSG